MRFRKSLRLPKQVERAAIVEKKGEQVYDSGLVKEKAGGSL